MSIKTELLEIQNANTQNILHAADVVKWAWENPSSALWRAIEWDDNKAAYEYRLSQVRQLIRLHVTAEGGDPLVVSLTIDRPVGGGYRNMRQVMSNPELRKILLNDALGELERLERKYNRLTELAKVWEEASRVRKK